MKRLTTDAVLADLDLMLASGPVVTCWRCEKFPGAPSLCVNCHAEVGYEAPPKNTKRVIWPGQ